MENDHSSGVCDSQWVRMPPWGTEDTLITPTARSIHKQFPCVILNHPPDITTCDYPQVIGLETEAQR